MYPSKELIKNISPVPRTVSEANRDAQYACAVQSFKSDVKLTIDFLLSASIGFLTVSIVALACYGLYSML